MARLLEIGQKLEGLYRHASTHAAGVVIGDRPLIELVPLYRDPRAELPVTQFNMKWVEAAGPGEVRLPRPQDADRARDGAEADRARGVDARSRQDCRSTTPQTYELLRRGDTVGRVPAGKSGHARRAAQAEARPLRGHHRHRRALPPGPDGQHPDATSPASTAARSRDYLHPLLEPILKETYGVIIYQEQVMQIAQVLAGYSLGEADLLRRAMGKKIKAEMAPQQDALRRGRGRQRRRSRRAPSYIFDLVDKFAGYGFNKSHAAAYALVAYQTAYLKANYPVEFIAASMTLDMGNTDKLTASRQEARRMGIRIEPPSVNHSEVWLRAERAAPSAIRSPR